MNEKKSSPLETMGLAISGWTEKWFPDSLVFALLGIAVTFLFGLCIGETPARMAVEGGKSFWALVPFTMQMAMTIIGGYAVATSPLVNRLIVRLAGVPQTPKTEVAFVAFF
ncbi:MAG: TIGR00366 family protein [Elusimicrobiaceae bacterium]|nr:TIGR00366 family protein [Elusimicrobiaceae bacterium]